MLSALLATLDGAVAMVILELEESRVVTSAGRLEPERLRILPFAAAEILASQLMLPVQAVFARRAQLTQEQRSCAVTEAMTISEEGFFLFQRSAQTGNLVLVTICKSSANLALIRAQTRKAWSDASSFL